MNSAEKPRILVINQSSIYPLRAMNQVRTNNMMRVLSKSFSVDLATTTNSGQEINESNKALKILGGQFYNLGSLKPKNNKLLKRLVQIGEKISYLYNGTDPELFQSYLLKNKIIKLINKNRYTIVISNYWENSLFFKDLAKGVYKILDPHYAVEENFEVFKNNNSSGLIKHLEKRRLARNRKMERIVINNSDLLLPLSQKTQNIFKDIAPSKDSLLVADGNDIEHFSSFPMKAEENTILFYGAMSSKQNVQAFFRFYNNILPKLRFEIPNIKLLVVGASPIPEISKLHDGTNIIVTGFVEDIRPWLAKAWFKIIPLELGSGFRGRVVELMSMGIPVVGTHNALDSLGFENGKEGFMNDNDEELISSSVKLLKDKKLRERMSNDARNFVLKNYSLEATFGKLEQFLIKRMN